MLSLRPIHPPLSHPYFVATSFPGLLLYGFLLCRPWSPVGLVFSSLCRRPFLSPASLVPLPPAPPFLLALLLIAPVKRTPSFVIQSRCSLSPQKLFPLHFHFRTTCDRHLRGRQDGIVRSPGLSPDAPNDHIHKKIIHEDEHAQLLSPCCN